MSELLSNIIAHLEEVAPITLQEDYDNAGLITGQSTQLISKALICLDSTEAVVDEAIAIGAELIVAHHPIVFKGLKKLNGKNEIERSIIKAIKHDIAIYAIHTNLDNVLHQGVSEKMALVLGLEGIKVLQPIKGKLIKLSVYVPDSHLELVKSALFSAGAGHVGHYDHCSFSISGIGTFRGNAMSNPSIGMKGEQTTLPEYKVEVLVAEHKLSRVIQEMLAVHPYEEVAYDVIKLEQSNSEIGAGAVGYLPKELDGLAFLELIKQRFRAPCIRYTTIDGSRKIKKVALCGGSGSFLLEKAKLQNADAFISSDFKYHQFFDAEGALMIADIGHYEGEYFTIELIGDILKKKFNTFAILFSENYTNPIKYHS